MNPQRLSPIDLAILAALTLALGAYVILFHFPAPYFDDWDVVPMLEAADRGALDWRQLFNIHGGHWHAAAYAIFIPLAQATGWSHLAEAIAILIFLFATGAVLLALAGKFAGAAAPEAKLGPFAIAALFLCFTLDQSSNLLWNFQLSVFIAMFGAALCIAALAQARFTWIHALVAQAGLALSVLSYATGFALVPVGVLMIALRTDASVPRRIVYALLWSAIGAAWTTAFLVGQQNSPYQSGFSVRELLSQPAFYAYLAEFELRYLGAAIARVATSLVIPLAIVGPALALVCAFFLGKRGVTLRALAIPLALCAFGLGAGVLCGFGRFEFGAGQGGNGRYFSFSLFFWLGATWLLLAALAHLQGKALRRSAIGFIAVCALLKLASGVQAAIKNVEITEQVVAAAAAMRANPANAADVARVIAFERQDVAPYVDFIRRKRWSVFRDAQPAPNS